MIITAQPFFNELDLLELKFEEMAGVVDLHVVVESPITFSGISKPLVFKENAARFAKWPVQHVVCDLPRDVESPWDREYAAHQAIAAAVKDIKPDVVIWVDTDECPRSNVVDRFLAMNVQVASLDMDMILFSMDRIDTRCVHHPCTIPGRWRRGKITRGTEQPGRGDDFPDVVSDAGWHFEYLGGRDLLLEKIAATSHAPESGTQDFARGISRGVWDGLQRTESYAPDRLPRTVQMNRSRFAPYFLEFSPEQLQGRC